MQNIFRYDSDMIQNRSRRTEPEEQSEEQIHNRFRQDSELIQKRFRTDSELVQKNSFRRTSRRTDSELIQN